MRQVGMRYGLILGLISIAVSLISHMMGVSDPSRSTPVMSIIAGVVSIGIIFLLIFLALKHYRDEENNGTLTLGDAIKLGLLVAIVAALIAGVFNLLYFNLIEPDYYDTIVAGLEERFEDQGMEEAQIEQALRITKIFTNPVMSFLTGIISSAFMGLIISLVAGLILKKEPAPIV